MHLVVFYTYTGGVDGSALRCEQRSPVGGADLAVAWSRFGEAQHGEFVVCVLFYSPVFFIIMRVMCVYSLLLVLGNACIYTTSYTCYNITVGIDSPDAGCALRPQSHSRGAVGPGCRPAGGKYCKLIYSEGVVWLIVCLGIHIVAAQLSWLEFLAYLVLVIIVNTVVHIRDRMTLLR